MKNGSGGGKAARGLGKQPVGRLLIPDRIWRAGPLFRTDLFQKETSRRAEIIRCIVWLRKRLCFCPVFIITDVYSLLNGPTGGLWESAHEVFSGYSAVIREMAYFRQRTGGKGILNLFWEYLNEEGLEIRGSDRNDSCHRSFTFLKHLIRSYFPLVDRDMRKPEARQALLEALEEFSRAYECLSIRTLADGADSPFVAALEGFCREYLAADFDFSAFTSFLGAAGSVSHETSDLIDFHALRGGKPLELPTGDVDVEITTDLEKAERFFDSEWLKGDPFYLSGPDQEEGAGYTLPQVEKRIEEEGRELGLDARPLDPFSRDSLTRDLHFFENVFLQDPVRENYLKLRQVHQLSEAMFRLKVAFVGFESYRYYEPMRPRTEDMVVRIQVDATENWQAWARQGFETCREAVIERVSLGLGIARLLFAQRDLRARARVLVHCGTVTHEMSGDAGLEDFEDLFTRMYFSFALTGIWSSAGGGGSFETVEDPDLAADILIPGKKYPEYLLGRRRVRLFLIDVDGKREYVLRSFVPGDRLMTVGTSADQGDFRRMVLKELFSQLLSISLLEEETSWNR